jgi:hypothetical protein
VLALAVGALVVGAAVGVRVGEGVGGEAGAEVGEEVGAAATVDHNSEPPRVLFMHCAMLSAMQRPYPVVKSHQPQPSTATHAPRVWESHMPVALTV